MGQPKQRDANGFTPTQALIIQVLIDGTWHRQDEVMRAIESATEYRMEINTLHCHMSKLKAMLDKRSEVIITRQDERFGTMYRYGRLLAPLANG